MGAAQQNSTVASTSSVGRLRISQDLLEEVVPPETLKIGPLGEEPSFSRKINQTIMEANTSTTASMSRSWTEMVTLLHHHEKLSTAKKLKASNAIFMSVGKSLLGRGEKYLGTVLDDLFISQSKELWSHRSSIVSGAVGASEAVKKSTEVLLVQALLRSLDKHDLILKNAAKKIHRSLSSKAANLETIGEDITAAIDARAKSNKRAAAQTSFDPFKDVKIGQNQLPSLRRKLFVWDKMVSHYEKAGFLDPGLAETSRVIGQRLVEKKLNKLSELSVELFTTLGHELRSTSGEGSDTQPTAIELKKKQLTTLIDACSNTKIITIKHANGLLKLLSQPDCFNEVIEKLVAACGPKNAEQKADKISAHTASPAESQQPGTTPPEPVARQRGLGGRIVGPTERVVRGLGGGRPLTDGSEVVKGLGCREQPMVKLAARNSLPRMKNSGSAFLTIGTVQVIMMANHRNEGQPPSRDLVERLTHNLVLDAKDRYESNPEYKNHGLSFFSTSCGELLACWEAKSPTVKARLFGKLQKGVVEKGKIVFSILPPKENNESYSFEEQQTAIEAVLQRAKNTSCKPFKRNPLTSDFFSVMTASQCRPIIVDTVSVKNRAITLTDLKGIFLRQVNLVRSEILIESTANSGIYVRSCAWKNSTASLNRKISTNNDSPQNTASLVFSNSTINKCVVDGSLRDAVINDSSAITNSNLRACDLHNLRVQGEDLSRRLSNVQISDPSQKTNFYIKNNLDTKLLDNARQDGRALLYSGPSAVRSIGWFITNLFGQVARLKRQIILRQRDWPSSRFERYLDSI